MSDVRHFWDDGFSRLELEEAQKRYNFIFPINLFELLCERRKRGGYDWSSDISDLRDAFLWPFETLFWHVEHDYWWPQWGKRPNTDSSRKDCLREFLLTVPKLIPIRGQRFIPETPSTRGNPVFSVRGFDVIYYGSNVVEFFLNELTGSSFLGPTTYVQPWGDLADVARVRPNVRKAK